MTICFLDFEDLFGRMFRTKSEYGVYRAIIRSSGLKLAVAQTNIKTFHQTRNGQERANELVDAAEHLHAVGLPMFRGLDWKEILIQYLYETVKGRPAALRTIFGHTDNEASLYSKIKWYLQREENFAVRVTANLKRERWPDVFGVKSGTFGGFNTLAVDAKAKYSEFSRFLEQCTMFLKYSNHVSVCTTPGMVAEVGMKQASLVAHGEKEFKRMLESAKAGAYIIDLTGNVTWKVSGGPDSEYINDTEKRRRLQILGYKK